MPRRPGRPAGLRLNGQEVYRLRVDVHGLSAAELGNRIGFKDAVIWKAERSESISDVLASRLAKAFGVSVDDLRADDTEPEALASLDTNEAPRATGGPKRDTSRSTE